MNKYLRQIFLINRYCSLRDEVKKYALDRNVHVSTFFLMYLTMKPLLILSAVLAMFSAVGIFTLYTFPEYGILAVIGDWIGPMFLLVYIGVGFFTIGKYLMFGYIKLFQYISKLIMYCVNRFEMRWWRKHKDDSPVIDAMAKIGEKQGKIGAWVKSLSKPKRILLQVTIVVLLLSLMFYMHGQELLDSFQELYDEIVKSSAKMEEVNVGKIDIDLSERDPIPLEP